MNQIMPPSKPRSTLFFAQLGGDLGPVFKRLMTAAGSFACVGGSPGLRGTIIQYAECLYDSPATMIPSWGEIAKSRKKEVEGRTSKLAVAELMFGTYSKRSLYIAPVEWTELPACYDIYLCITDAFSLPEGLKFRERPTTLSAASKLASSIAHSSTHSPSFNMIALDHNAINEDIKFKGNVRIDEQVTDVDAKAYIDPTLVLSAEEDQYLRRQIHMRWVILNGNDHC